MEYKSYTVYDNQDFFDAYIQKRSLGGSPNETLEKPIMDELIGDVQGKDILDLGCGDGKYGKSLLEKGAKTYLGVDGSTNMTNLAMQGIESPQMKIEQATIEKYQFEADRYDLVISRLVFHYIENLDKIFEDIHKSLRKNGSLIFSIEHPIITSCYDAYHQKVKRKNWIVDNYFKNGKRVNTWIGKEVVKYHKTIEDYFKLFKSAGFQLSELRESKPAKSNFSSQEEYERRSRIPLFMMFKLGLVIS